MSDSQELTMLNALELFHYSSRFRGHLFVLVLESDVNLKEIMSDIRVIHGSHIEIILVCYRTPKLENFVEEWNKRGFEFEYFKNVVSTSYDAGQIDLELERAREGKVTVIDLMDDAEEKDLLTLDSYVLHLCNQWDVDKLFFLSMRKGLTINGHSYSHLTTKEAESQLAGCEEINITKKRFSQIVEEQKKDGCDVVFLESNSGYLFEEIFTHRGKGTLLTNDYSNEIRMGLLSDVFDISLLMKSYIKAGYILPVSEDQLAKDIDAYFVYSVNGFLVAAAKLNDYGDASELAKFCTLPRYQGRGRAKKLAHDMIEKARDSGKHYVFALSIDPRMWRFFEGLGFKECDREKLPEQWKSRYNFSRPSKAFQLLL